MPKEIFSNILQPDQPFVLSKGELSQKFRVLSSQEVEKLGFKKKTKPQEIKSPIGITPEQAQEILDKNYLGIEAIETTFGFQPEEIPPIPFSAVELERAKELNQFLELRIDKTNDGEPLDMKKMHTLLQPKFTAGNNGKILNSYGQADCWYKDESFLQETPRFFWVLATKDLLPGSKGKNYLQQTEIIVDYLINSVFKDQELPGVYQEAIEEFQSKKANIEALMSSDWQKAAQELQTLSINQLCRKTFVEDRYDFLMQFQTNSIRLTEEDYNWTLSRASDGKLVVAGGSVAVGACVLRWLPYSSLVRIGVAFSRSL